MIKKEVQNLDHKRIELIQVYKAMHKKARLAGKMVWAAEIQRRIERLER